MRGGRRSWGSGLAAAAMLLATGAAAAPAALDFLPLNAVRMLGSHNSYRPYPTPQAEGRIRRLSPQDWPDLAYGHPPLEAQLALGLRQFEIDVAPDPAGGLYAGPYAYAAPAARAAMAAPGAKVLHVAGLDYDTHCLTLRACLAVFARWSDAHPGHTPLVVLVNASDVDAAPYQPRAIAFTAADIDAVDRDVRETLGARLLTPDEVRGGLATLREAVRAGGWPRLGALRGRIIAVLDGSPAHEDFLRAGHSSLRGRALFGWFDEAAPEAALFNVQDPLLEGARIRRLVAQGFLVRTRADLSPAEARARDGRRMAAALASGAQLISTDDYAGAPDPEGLGYVADFGGPYVRPDAAAPASGSRR